MGHEISAKDMLPGQKGVEEIAHMGPPTMYTGIRKFIGAVGYFHRFIKNFAQIAKPLNDKWEQQVEESSSFTDSYC